MSPAALVVVAVRREATNFAAMTKLAAILAAYEYLRPCFSTSTLMY